MLYMKLINPLLNSRGWLADRSIRLSMSVPVSSLFYIGMIVKPNKSKQTCLPTISRKNTFSALFYFSTAVCTELSAVVQVSATL